MSGLGAIGQGQTLDLVVVGRGGVPLTGVTAVALNVTVTNPTIPSFLTVWPTGDTRPTASNLNFAAGDTIPNMVIAKVGDSGRVSIFNSSGAADVIVDVAGWFATGSGFTPLTPARLADTRTGSPTTDGLMSGVGAIGQGQTLDLVVVGRGGVPLTGVTAVALNVTVTNPTIPSFLTVWPTGDTRPTASNLNFAAGDTIPNMVIAKVGDSGRVSIFNSSGAADVIVDVAGWFATGSGFTPLTPARLADSRTGGPTSPLAPGSYELGLGSFPSLSPDGRYVTYYAGANSGSAYWAQIDLVTMSNSPLPPLCGTSTMSGGVVPLDDGDLALSCRDSAGQEFASVWRRATNSTSTVAVTQGFKVTPDGKYLFFVPPTAAGQRQVVRRLDTRASELITLPAKFTSLPVAISASGRFAAFQYFSTSEIYDLTTQTSQPVPATDLVSNISANGDWVTFSRFINSGIGVQVFVWRPATGAQVQVLADLQIAGFEAVSAGARFVIGAKLGQVKEVIDLVTGQSYLIPKPTDRRSDSTPFISADGRTIVTSEATPTDRLVPTKMRVLVRDCC